MEKRRDMNLTGTLEFVEELRKRTFKSAEAVLQPVTNENFTSHYLIENGFNSPILIQKPDGLNMKTPTFEGWANLEECVGGDKIVEVIDVEQQNYCLIPFSAMMKYMKRQCRTKTLNLISLECSDTSLGKMIQPPAVAYELDWVSQYWSTRKHCSDVNNKDMPRVQKYCLVSPINAYTDFHIDFGGSSVWYHVVKGAKTFYLIRPTVDNMYLYGNWQDSVSRLRTFFADQVDDCYKVTLLPGNTLFLPTGWIHAVLTIEDSLVFGGNFLHSLNMERQLEVYAMESRARTPERLMYPNFEELHWRAARGLSKELEELNSKSIASPSYLLNGLKAVLKYLKQWTSSSRSYLSGKEKIFIIKNLNRHIKNSERLLLILNPPKPERGSTRPRKKRILEDFIDYPVTSSRKKLIRKPKQTLDYLNDTSSNEKWLVQNGGTKVVFRKLKGLQRKNGNIQPNLLVSENLQSIRENEVQNFRNMNTNPMFISSDSEISSEETWAPNQPSSSNPVLNSQQFIRSPLKVCPLNSSEFDEGDEWTDSEIEEKEFCRNNDSNKLVVVHQDDEYIYPSLLLSDDEVQGSRLTTKDKDMPWNPKAKVGHVVPRTDRPSRIGKQKVAVEKGLEEAAAVCDSPTLQPKDLKKKYVERNPGCKNFVNNTPPPKISRSPIKGRRRYSTVKQRLSKILKLHRRQH